MNLRCRPGDLCVIVKVAPDTEHLLGRIIRLGKNTVSTPNGPAWRYVGARLRRKCGRNVHVAEDIALRPLRDNPGEDEILRIAGKPAITEFLKAAKEAV